MARKVCQGSDRGESAAGVETLVLVDESALLSQREIGDLPLRVVPLGTAVSAERGARTSAVAPGTYLEAMKAVLPRKEVKGVLVLTVAARLSATYQSALLASGQARERLAGLRVEVVDSATATGGLALVALAAARAAGALDEAAAAARAIIPRIVTYGMVSDWMALRRGGRIPRVAAWAGGRLGVRPCFRMTAGVVRPWRLARTKRQAVAAMQRGCAGLPGGALHAAVFHAGMPDAAEELASGLAALGAVELLTLAATDAVRAHTGDGMVGVGAYREP